MINNKFFPEIHGIFGFGCMRLPEIGDKIDIEQFKEMVDYFISKGLNYFDTAHGYHNGLSELAIKDALTSRYPRSAYLLTDKLTEPYFNKEEDIVPFFQSQLKATGVEYFDFYLMHAQNRNNYVKFKRCHAYETAAKLKQEGKIRHLGISFHDTPDILDMILTEHPEVEVVQIQFNYVDYNDPMVQSKGCYDVCVKHGKPCLIMEPVKGGKLIKLSDEGQAALDECNKRLGVNQSNAAYALRFVGSFDNVTCILSGMSNMEQVKDNLSFMADFKPLGLEEKEAIAKVVDSYRKLDLIGCTSCKYCITENHCPKNINIPSVFSCMNARTAFNDWNQNFYYSIITNGAGKAGDCIGCKGCERVCPQHLEISALLKKVSKEFDR